MSSQTNWKPLIYSISIVLVIGIIITLVSNSFTLPETSQSSTASTLARFVQNGTSLSFTLPVAGIPISIPFNFFGWLGSGITELIANDIIGMSLIPTVVLIPLLIVLILGVAYPLIYIIIDIIGAIVP
jgi:hypothetical protein